MFIVKPYRHLIKDNKFVILTFLSFSFQKSLAVFDQIGKGSGLSDIEHNSAHV